MARPNILFIFTDQQRWDTIGALGNPIIRTPTLDRLCAEGTAFTSCYTPSPVCVSARCSLVTGQPPHRTGCDDNLPMPADLPSFMDSLSAAGYQCHGLGKMHFTPHRDRLWGFESRIISEEGYGEGDQFVEHLKANGYQHVYDPHGVRSEMYYVPQPSQLPARLHHTAWCADRSLEFLDRRDPSRPFFLWTSIIKPHPPFENPTPWNKLYRASEMPPPRRPPGYQGLWTWQNRHQNRYKWRDQGIDENLVRCIRAAYYGAISFIDYQVGRIIAQLEAGGELDNTLIAFSSDHGEHLGDYDCFGKRSFLDTAARVPLLLRWPGQLAAGGRCDAPATLLDLAPTFCAAAAAGPPAANLPGVDLRDLAAGRCERDMVVGQHQHAGLATYAAVTARWKYFHSVPDRQDYLFDRQADPHELHNLAYSPTGRAAARAMRQRLTGYFRDEGYTAPLDGEGWREFPPPRELHDPDQELLFQDWGGSVDFSALPAGYQRPPAV
ncbi:MAG: sulfatase-like hydrolase/transferase [Fimbriimonadaceae bacterium]|nr:sulfatase-like hydrolase/transferase [Fimbriimonadaceae bacterium]